MRIVIVLILLLISAFFSSSETAITSISIAKIRQLKEDDKESAEILKRMKRKTNEIVASIVIGNNIANTAATAILTELIVQRFVSKNSTLVATVIMTISILIIGEITPKSYASQNPVKVAVKVAKPLELIATAFKPMLVILTKTTNVIIKLLGGDIVTNSPFVTEEEIRSLVDVGEEEGTIRHKDKEMIEGIFEINDIDVTEVMVPRIDVIATSDKTTLREVLDQIITYGHSRIPVYKNTIDNIIGILYAKDMLAFSSLKDKSFDEKSIIELMRPAYYVPETKKVNQLLRELQQQKVHIAIVLDEYGGTEGLVTIEDILEEIVGDILDEYDNEVDLIEKIDENIFLVKADVSLEEINEIFRANLPKDEFDSLGGFVFGYLGRVPIKGDVVTYEDLQMTVMELDNRRIVAIQVKKMEKL